MPESSSSYCKRFAVQLRTAPCAKTKKIGGTLGVGRPGLGAFNFGRRLSSQRFAERIHRNWCVRDLDDLEMLRLPRRVQIHAVATARLHQRTGERRAPADVAAVEVQLVDAYDRDDVFDAGSVLVGDGCTEEDARGG
jgi:hypothetical protein